MQTLKLHNFWEHVGCVLYWMKLGVILNINVTLNIMVYYAFLGYVVKLQMYIYIPLTHP
jgi:hypothetical protein